MDGVADPGGVAGRAAPKGREADERDIAGNEEKEGGIAETGRVIFHALIIALVIRTFLFQPFNIPSGSMKETLLVGDYLFVSKYSYGYSHYSLPFSPPLFPGRIWAAQPNRGDVLVFRLPKDDPTDYIKRVIGLPGDRIQMIDGVLNINGEPVKRERIEDFVETEGRARRGSSAGVNSAQRRELHDARSRRQRLLRQHPGVSGAGRPWAITATTPPTAVCSAKSATCRSRTLSAAPRSSSSPFARASTPGWYGAGRGPCAGIGCSRSYDEPRANRHTGFH